VNSCARCISALGFVLDYTVCRERNIEQIRLRQYPARGDSAACDYYRDSSAIDSDLLLVGTN
jgi:hypothetical protein